MAKKAPKGRWLLPVLILVAGLAAVGGVAGLILYNDATRPDRHDPEVTVRQFLTAVFVEEDLARVGLFVCEDLDAAEASAQARNLVDPDAVPSWDTVVTDERVDGRAQVSIRMRFRYPGELAASGQEQWVFNLIDDDGWRVCSFRSAG